MAFKQEKLALAVRLRELREERELSREAAAEKSGLSVRHLKRMEAGTTNVTLSSLVALARAYGCAVRDLFG